MKAASQGAKLPQIDLVDTPDDALRQAIAAPLLQFNSALAGPSGHRAGAGAAQ